MLFYACLVAEVQQQTLFPEENKHTDARVKCLPVCWRMSQELRLEGGLRQGEEGAAGSI